MPGLSPIARACRRGASPQSASLGRARTRAPDDALQKGTGRARTALRCSVAIDGKRVERAHRVPALERTRLRLNAGRGCLMRLRTELGLPIKGGAAIQLKNISTAIEHYDPFLHQPRAFGTDWLPRRLLGSDPRGVFAGPASVRHLVRRTPPRTVLCAATDIESFARHLEVRGRARATIARRLGTVTGFYRYAVEEGVIEHSPAVHVRKPRLDYESHAVGLDRKEVGALLVAAGLAGARDHALVSLLCLNGLRVSEAVGADVERLALERGHRTLTITRTGGKVTPFLSRPAPPGRWTWRWASAAKVPSCSEHMAPAWIAMLRRASCVAWPAGRASPSGWAPTRCVTPSSPRPSTPACLCATCRRRPATPTRARPCAMTEVGCPSIATPRTSWPHSWPARPADLEPLRSRDGGGMGPGARASTRSRHRPVASVGEPGAGASDMTVVGERVPSRRDIGPAIEQVAEATERTLPVDGDAQSIGDRGIVERGDEVSHVPIGVIGALGPHRQPALAVGLAGQFL